MKKKRNVPRATLEQEQLKVVGRAVRNRRVDLRKKLLDVAGVSGVSSLTISKLEKGELNNCSLETLNKIASSLQLKIQIVVHEKE